MVVQDSKRDPVDLVTVIMMQHFVGEYIPLMPSMVNLVNCCYVVLQKKKIWICIKMSYVYNF